MPAATQANGFAPEEPASRTVEVDASGAAPTVPEQILIDARTPPPRRDDGLVRLGRWLDDTTTRTTLILLSLALVAAGLVLFLPPPRVSMAAEAPLPPVQST